jgi:RNA polymerase-binding transcription factor DksA
LTPPQNAVLERSLDTLEEGVRKKIHETLPQVADEKYTELVGNVYDFGDEAAASTQQDFNHALLERYLNELQQIEAVRRRLAEGEVDRCTACGEAIDYRRLLAYPFATRCIECQARHEKFGAEAIAPRA